MSKYTMITSNIMTATSRKTATYFIRTEVIKSIPDINELRELELTRFADYVVRDGTLVKDRHDITGLLTKVLLS